MCVCVYVCVCVCARARARVCVCVRERERDRDREIERETEREACGGGRLGRFSRSKCNKVRAQITRTCDRLNSCFVPGNSFKQRVYLVSMSCCLFAVSV